MTTQTATRKLKPAWIVAALAAAGLAFAARASQDTPPPQPQQPQAPQGQQAEPAPLDGPQPSTGEMMGEPEGNEGDVEDIERAVGEAVAEPPAQLKEVPAAAANAVVQHTDHLQGLQLWRKAKLVDGAYVAKTADGKTARLSIDAALQKQMDKLLRMYNPVGAAVVALDPKTGKVLAMSEYAADGKPEGLATRAAYPAASVFKIITGAALLEKGVNPADEICYHGGLHGIAVNLLKDTRLDRRCLSLSMALAKSANVVFAKMAVKHLDGDSLRKEAERFLFNRPIFDQPMDQSSATIPASGLDFAKSAAGFGQVKLSPMHAALIAASVGNGGIAVEPTMLDSVGDEQIAPTGSVRLMKAETAASLRDMMKLTVSSGTATSSFRERSRNILGTIEVAGKTGSLSDHKGPFKDYSWFVGFAPANDPKIAVAAVVVNGLKWRVHAPFVAREALKAYLVGGPIGNPPPAARSRHYRKKQHAAKKRS